MGPYANGSGLLAGQPMDLGGMEMAAHGYPNLSHLIGKNSRRMVRRTLSRCYEARSDGVTAARVV